MKLVDFETFVRLPAGTIFAPYTPCVLEERLAVKTCEGWDTPDSPYYSHVFNGVMPLHPWVDSLSCLLYDCGDEQPASFESYDGDNNDYRDYKLFLVFDEADIDRLIKVLEWAKGGCVGSEEEFN